MADRPKWVLKRFCLACQGGDADAVGTCRDIDCLLYALRPYQRPGGAEPGPTSVARAIRRFCLTCSGSRQEVRGCDAKECDLWSYRFGVSPSTFKRVLARRRRSRGALTLPGLNE
jgi:hypothetical protein